MQSLPFSMTSFTRDEATATLLKEEEPFQEASTEQVEPEQGGKIIPQRDATFASLKPHMNYPTWKALTVKPFAYKEMSDVQQKVLHLLPELANHSSEPMSDGEGGRDMLVKARTGTGKTIAFLVPAIERRVNAIYNAERGRLTEPFQKKITELRPDFDFESLDKHGRQALAREFSANTVGTLILSPTRELATQIANEAVKLHYNYEKFGVQLLVGGQPRMHQLRDWRRSRPDVVVATPGRMKDLMQEPMVRDALQATQTVVLDEADTLLDMGFTDEIEEILRGLPQGSQRTTMLFSATVSKSIREISRKSLQRDHRFIDCVPKGEDNVHQHIPQSATVLDSAADQVTHLIRLISLDQLQNPGKSKVIVFANTTKHAILLSQILGSREIKNSFPVQTTKYELHSQKDQKVRFNTSDKFRRDQSGASVLVTTDVSARGVDYPGTTRVIQVGAPSELDQYIHRIGRTGRAGAQGNADIILLPMEAGFLHTNLNDLPVKQRSVQETKSELEGIAAKFDDDPTSVIEASILNEMSGASKEDFRGKRRGRDDQSSRRAMIQKPLLQKITTIPETVQDVAQSLDQETVSMVFMSLVGFYIGRAATLRLNKTAVVEGLKRWAVEAGGLEMEPFISRNMAEKLGLGGGGGGGESGYGRGGGDRRGRGGFSRFGGGDRGGRGGGSRFGGGGYGGGRYNDTRLGDDAGGERGGFSSRGGFSRGGRGGFGDRDSRFGRRDGDSESRFSSSGFGGRGGSRGGFRSRPEVEFSSSD